MRIQGMGRRKMRTGAEYDVHTAWRKAYCYTQRAGVCASVKRDTRRRERRESAKDYVK